MKRKSGWLVLSCLMVLSLVMASCAAAEVEEEVVTPGEEEVAPVEEEEVAAGPEMVRDSLGRLVEKPRYGGTVTTIWTGPTGTDIFDPVVSTRSVGTAVQTYGRLGTADWSRGPTGTNEFPFSTSYIPDGFLTGDLAESWEIIDLRTIIYHLRQGVRWHNVPPVNGREFTADDVVYSSERAAADPQFVGYESPAMPEDKRGQAIAIDKYTVKLIYGEESTRQLHGNMNWLYIMPREMVEEYGDLNDWRHQCGTGPFMLVDCVPASSVTWIRNPNYHLFDPSFPENRLPYVDKFEALVIPDESTRLAALRTHKVERMWVPWDKVESMKKTSPELLWREVLPDSSALLFTRTDIEPFSDKKVRQALSLAIDQPAILREYYQGSGYILLWPIMPSFVTHYTPLEELPETSRKLYEHHPDLARQLLAEAGYPDGFKTEVAVSSVATRWIDVMSIVKEYLADVGVVMEINVMEPGTWQSVLFAKNFAGMIYCDWANNAIDDALGWAHGGDVGADGTHSVYAFGNIIDPIAQETYERLKITLDPVEQERIRKEECVREIDLCWEIPLPTAAWFVFWMPWIKGYTGEVGVGPDQYENDGIFRYVWIDQDLKYAMTGAR